MNVRRLRRATPWIARRSRPRHALVVIASGQEAARLPEPLDDAIVTSLGRGEAVELVVLDFTWNAAPTVPEGVAVRRFWRDAIPGIGRFVMSPPDSLAPMPMGEDGWGDGAYSNGVPTIRLVTSAVGRRVDHLTPWGAVVRRDEIDRGGRLVRTVDVDPHTGEDVTHRYIADDGSCWLSVPLRDSGPVRQLKPTTRTYSALESIQATWVSAKLPERRRLRVLAAGPASGRVASRLAT